MTSYWHFKGLAKIKTNAVIFTTEWQHKWFNSVEKDPKSLKSAFVESLGRTNWSWGNGQGKWGPCFDSFFWYVQIHLVYIFWHHLGCLCEGNLFHSKKMKIWVQSDLEFWSNLDLFNYFGKPRNPFFFFKF